MNCLSKKEYIKHRHKKLIWFFVIIFGIILSIILYFNLYVNPIIITTNKAVIKSKTISIINSSVEDTISANIYDDLITITYDSNGNITSIKANSILANQLNTKILNVCQTNLENMTKLTFDVPLGSFTGIPIFNGLGPNITIKMLPIGTVQTQFKSEFVSAGINQTYHKIYLDIQTEISVLLPGTNQSVSVNTQILIGESIIVGEVPQVYLGNSALNSQLNLLP